MIIIIDAINEIDRVRGKQNHCTQILIKHIKKAKMS